MGSTLDQLIAQYGGSQPGDDDSTPQSPLDQVLAKYGGQKPDESVLGQVGEGLSDVYQAVRHLPTTLESFGENVVRGARAGLTAPVIGEKVYPSSPFLTQHGVIAPEGHENDVVTSETPGAVTPGEQAKGALNTSLLALPGLRWFGRAIVNTGVGAAEAPAGQRIRGAVGGLVTGELFHQGISHLLPEVAPKPAEGEGGSSVIDAAQVAEQAKAGGFTINPTTGEPISTGYAVGGLVKRGEGTMLAKPPEALTPEDVAAHHASLAPLFQENPNATYGGWINPETGNVEIEPGEVYPRMGTALLRGADVGEQAIYDLEHGETITVPDLAQIDEAAREWGVDRETAAEILSGHDATATPDEAPSTPESAARPTEPGAAGGAVSGDHGAEGVDEGATPGVDREAPGATPSNGGSLVPRAPIDAGGSGGGGGSGAGGADLLGEDRDPINLDDFLNRAKIVTSDPVARAALDIQLEKTIEDNGLNPKERVSRAETEAAAKELALDPDQLAAGAGTMDRATFHAAKLTLRRNLLTQSGLARAMAERGQTPELMDAFRSLADQNMKIMARMIRSRSEHGRTLAMHRYEASQTTDPTFWLLRAQTAKGAPLTPADQADVLDAVKRVQSTPQNSLKRTAAQKLLAGKIDRLKPGSGGRLAGAAYRASLLSGVHTLAGAAIGHAAWGVAQAVDENLAAALDNTVVSMLSGVKSLDFNLARDLHARWRGIVRGVGQANNMMRHGITGADDDITNARTEFDLAKVGDSALLRAGKTALGAPIKYILRAYSYIPTIVKAQAKEAELDQMARLAVRKAKPTLRGGAFRAAVREVRNHPTTQMLAAADEQAEVAALTQQNILTQLAHGIQRGASEAGEAVGGEKGKSIAEAATTTFMPFTTVPSNIATQAVEHSPAAGGLAAIKLFRLARMRDVLDPADPRYAEKLKLQRDAARQMAHTITGSVALAVGYKLAADRLMSGPSPDSKAARDTRFLAGEQPNALLVDHGWFSDAKLAPVANMIELGGIIYDALHNPSMAGSRARQGEAVAKGFTQELADAPYFEGMQNVSRSLENPGSFAGNYVKEAAKGLVPNILDRVELATDPYRREPSSTSFLGGLGQELEGRLPFAAKRLPVVRNQFGEPVTHQTGVAAILSPFPGIPDNTADPAVRVLLDTGVNVSRLEREPRETQEQFEAREERFGSQLHQALTIIAKNPMYQNEQVWVHAAEAYKRQFPAQYANTSTETLARAIRADQVQSVVTAVRDAVGQPLDPMQGLSTRTRALASAQ